MNIKNTLDIVHLIEKNPLTRLSCNYNNKFVKKLQESFTEAQQHLFIASFYSYLNYNSKNDFVIDFDQVWKWLGYNKKNDCKKVLEKHFTIDIDYTIKAAATSAALNKPKVRGCAGLNKELIMLNINTFKNV